MSSQLRFTWKSVLYLLNMVKALKVLPRVILASLRTTVAQLSQDA